ncbi:MAG: hypothetical protein AAGA84_11850 [Pseudomonadota bacterium]
MLTRLCVLAFAFLLVACSSADSPEAQIRAIVAEVAAAAEARQTRSIAAHISPSYADLRGHDKASLVNLVRATLLRGGSLVILTDIQSIALITERLAEAKVSVRFNEIDVRRLGLASERYTFIVQFERNGTKWQVVAARWATGDDDPR